MTTFFGTAGANLISGDALGDDTDVIYGGPDTSGTGTGDDTLNGFALSDTLYGGDGADTLRGGTGSDLLYGGTETDIATYSSTISLADLTATGTTWQVNGGAEGTDILNGVEIVDGAGPGRILLVGSGGFTSIQAAVDAAVAGDTILVAPGTYDEDVTITHGVTLMGANHGVSGAGARSAETIILGRVVVNTAADVTIDGFEIRADGTTGTVGPSAPALSILLAGTGAAGHVVTNTVFFADFNGGANGVDARAISMSPSATGKVTVDDNLFTGTAHSQFSGAAWGRGIWADGGGVELHITDNTFNSTRTAINYDDTSGTVADIHGNDFELAGTAVSVAQSQSLSGVVNNEFENVEGYLNAKNLTTPVVYNWGTSGNTFLDADVGSIEGGTVSDTITGANASDILLGNGGDDSLYGGADDDVLFGGNGADKLYGGLGNDLLIGNDAVTSDAQIDAATYAGTVSLNNITTTADANPFVAGNQPGWVVTSADGTDTLLQVEAVDDSAPGRILLVSSGGFASINAAIAASQSGDTILIAAGTYNENVVVNVAGVTLQGQGNVTIQGTFETSNGVTGDLSEWIKTHSYSGAAGAGVEVTASNVTLNNINIDGFLYGVDFSSDVSHTTLTDVDISNSVIGIEKATTANLDGLTVTGGSVVDGYIGIDFAKVVSAGSQADGTAVNVLIDGMHFQDLTAKGIYVEALSDSTITGVSMNHVGFWGSGAAFGGPYAGAGIELNLKNGVYQNVTITDFDLQNTGTSSHDNSAAISVKTRDDAPSYSGFPATWVGAPLEISDGTINGTTTGIRAGETGKNVEGPDVDISGVTITGALHDAQNGDIENLSQSPLSIDMQSSVLVASPQSTGVLDITGTSGADTITAGGGADTISGGTGGDTITGAGGIDTAHYTGSIAANNVVTSGAGWQVTAGTEGVDILNSVEIVDGAEAGRILLVGNGGYATISAALAAANSGDTIMVAAGTYNEDITLSEGVTLLGANHGISSDGTRGAESIIHGRIVVNTTEATTIDGFRVVADGTTGTSGPTNGALRYEAGGAGAGHLVENTVFFSDIQGGANESRAIVTPTLADGKITIDDNLFTGSFNGQYGGSASWHRGIWTDGGGVDITITDNTFTNVRSAVNFDDTTGNSYLVATGNDFDKVGTGISFARALGANDVVSNNDYGNADGYLNFKNVTSSVTVDFGAGNNITDDLDPGSIEGGTTSDMLTGGNASDVLYGNGGADVLKGGADDDVLIGNDGVTSDAFVDAAAYTGTIALSSITTTADAFPLVPGSQPGWIVAGGAEGTDTLYQIEAVDDAAPGRILLVGSGGFATIQAAIDAAGASDRIYIAAGTYAENLTITKGVTLIGENGVKIQPVSGNVITINDGVNGANVSISNVEIVGVASAPNQGIGVDVQEGANVGTLTLDHVNIHGAGAYGVLVMGDDESPAQPPSPAADNVVITNSTFSNNGYNGTNGSAHIKFYGFDGDATLQHLTLTAPVDATPADVSDRPDYGIEFHGIPNSKLSSTPVPDLGTVTIDDVVMTGDYHKNALALNNYDDVSGLSVSNVNLSGVTTSWGPLFNIDAVTGNIDASGYGITFPAVAPATGFVAELQGDASPEVASSQSITGSSASEHLRGGAGDDQLHGGGANDLIDGETGADTMSGDAGNDVLRGGDGIDTATYSGTISLANLTTVTDADPVAAGNQAGWQVVGGADGTDLLSGVEIVDGAGPGRILLVGSGGFATIQAAVDAAVAGDTILVSKGTYTENVTITKGVTLMGAEHGVSGSATRLAADESVILGRVVVNTTADVTIDGFLIKADGTTGTVGPSAPALNFLLAGAGATGHVVTNTVFYSDVVGGGPDSRAISMSPSATGKVTVDDNLFTGQPQSQFSGAAWGRGIWADGGGVDLHITDNTFISTRTAINYDDTTGKTADIHGNDFKFVGTAVSVAESQGLTGVVGNTFENAEAYLNAKNVTTPVVYDWGASTNTFLDADVGSIEGGTVSDTITGANASDILLGNGGDDTLSGNGDSDLLQGGAGLDVLYGGLDGDTLQGGADNDVLYGGAGTDLLQGGAAADALYGGDDVDVLQGGTENDALYGGAGADSLLGEDGIDTAVYGGTIQLSDLTATGTTWQVNAGSDGIDILNSVEIVDGAGAGRILLVGSGGFASINAAIAASQSGDTILIAAGTYNENVVVNVAGVTLQGQGNVTIQGTFETSNGVTGDLSEWIKTHSYSGAAGAGVEVTASNVTLNNINIDGFLYGVDFSSDVSHTTLTDVDISNSVIGIEKATTANLDGLTVTGGSVVDGYIGIDFAKVVSAGSQADGTAVNVLIDGMHFQDLTAKGIYVEALSDSTITGVSMNHVGFWGSGAAFGGPYAGAGIELNLKNGVYQNVTITDFDLQNTGTSSHDNSAAISVKTRDDAPSYSGFPATWVGAPLEISDGTINGTTTGIRAGETGKNVEGPDVDISGVTITGALHDAQNGDIENLSQSPLSIDMQSSVLVASPQSTGVLDITGTSGADTITAGGGADTISGGTGNDTINGAAGTDVAAYDHSAADYTARILNGQLTVTDNNLTNGNEGTDSLVGIETLRFNGADDSVTNATTIAITGTPASVNEDTPFTFNVTVGDSDDPSVSISLAVSHGSLTLASSANVTVVGGGTGAVTVTGSAADVTAALQNVSYQGSLNYFGPDSLTVSTLDGNISVQATAAFNVISVNDAPDAVDDTNTVHENLSVSATAVTGVLANDTDVDGVTRTVTEVQASAGNVGNAVSGTYGTLTLAVDGSYTYVADKAAANALAGGATAIDSFTYTISDGQGGSDTATLRITVVGDNDAPTITSGNAFSMAENLTAAGSVVAVDPDNGASVTYSITGGADAALFSINPTTGALSFVSAPDFEHPTDAGTNNVYDLQVRASDGLGGIANQSISVTVTNTNPLLVTALGPVAENTTLVGDVDAVGGDTSNVTYAIAPAFDGAKFQINPTTGVLSFVTPPNFEAPTDSDTNNVYRVTVLAVDAGGNTTSQTYNITVTDANDAPDAVDDTNTVAEDSSLTVAAPGVLANDTDADVGATKVVSEVQGSAGNVGHAVLGTYGTLTLAADGSYGYVTDHTATNTLAAGQSVTDTFSYKVSDGLGGFDTANLTITVTGVNDTPDAVNDTGAVLEDGTLTVAAAGVLANDTDPDTLDGKTVSQVGGSVANVGHALVGTYGTLTMAADGSYTYVADQAAADTLSTGVTATDTFSYQLSDGHGGVDTANLVITVTGVNDTPVFLGAPPANLLIDGSFEDFNANGTYNSLFASTDASAINGWTIVQDGVQLVGEPYWEATDGLNSVQLLVGGTNHHGALEQTFATVAGVQYLVEFDMTANGADGAQHTTRVSADGQSQTFSAIGTNNNNNMGYTAKSFTFTADGTSATLRLENFDSNGLYGSVIDNVRVTAVGGVGGPSVGSVTEAADGSPGEVGNAVHQASGTVAFSDVDLTDTHTVSVAPGGGGYLGTLSANVANDSTGDGTGSVAWTFTVNDSALESLAVGQSLTQTYQLTLDDGHSGTATQTVTITINGANDAPDAVNDTGAVLEDGTLTVAAAGVLTNDTDPDTLDSKTVSQVGGSAANVGHALAGTYGTLTLAANGSYSYVADQAAADTLAASATATDTFTYQISDGHGGVDTANLVITVTGVNDAPDAVDDTNAVAEGGSLNIAAGSGVLANDTDVDTGATRTVTEVQGSAGNVAHALAGTYGTLTLAADGSYTYTADQAAANALAVGQTATDSFTYKISDGLGGVDTATLTITVTGVNDAPDAVNDTGSVMEDGTRVVTAANGVLANDTDPDTLDTKTVSQVGGSAANVGHALVGTYGTLTLAADGSYTYAADQAAADTLAAGATVTDTFSYQLSDGHGGLDTANLVITVTGANDAPVFTSPSTFSLAENLTAIGSVSATDVDTGSSVTYSISGGADAALFAINASSGALSFLSPKDFDHPTDAGANNVYDVQVMASDGIGGSANQSIQVTVTNTNPSLVATLGPVPENIITPVGDVDAVGGDTSGVTYSILVGLDGAKFKIDATTGELSFITSPNFEAPTDSDTNNIYRVTVQAADATGHSTQRTYDISVLDVNDGTNTDIVESNGATVLNKTTDTHRFFFEDSGVRGPDLKYLGTAVVENQFPGWAPIAAEAHNSGYDVVWKFAATNQYTVWHVDSTGNYTSSLTGVVSAGSYALQNLETFYAQDLNSDGTVGPVTTVVEASGATSLIQKADLFFLGTSGPTLKYLGADFVDNQIAGWNPIGAEAHNGGFDVIWKLDGADQYTAWHTDINGNYTSSLTGIVSGTSATLENLETTLSQDLNNDGTIGLATTSIEANGLTSLFQNVDKFVLGTGGPTLKYLGADLLDNQIPGWNPIAAEAHNGGFDVAWKFDGADQYTVWHTDSNGNYTSSLTGVVSGGSFALENLETGFLQDLNGDGTTGVVTTTIEASGATNLVQLADIFTLGTGGPVLKFGGAQVVDNQFAPGWNPIGVEARNGGFDVVWKFDGADQYTAFQHSGIRSLEFT